MTLMQDLKDYKKTRQRQRAVERSQKRQEGEKRLSQQIWCANCQHAKSERLSDLVAAKVLSFWNLSTEQQKLVEDFDCGRSTTLVKQLLGQRESAYRGAGASVPSQSPSHDT